MRQRLLPASDQKQIEADLLALLEEADAIALQRGAKLPVRTGCCAAHVITSFRLYSLVSEQGRWVVRRSYAEHGAGRPVRVYFCFPMTDL